MLFCIIQCVVYDVLQLMVCFWHVLFESCSIPFYISARIVYLWCIFCLSCCSRFWLINTLSGWSVVCILNARIVFIMLFPSFVILLYIDLTAAMLDVLLGFHHESLPDSFTCLMDPLSIVLCFIRQEVVDPFSELCIDLISFLFSGWSAYEYQNSTSKKHNLREFVRN